MATHIMQTNVLSFGTCLSVKLSWKIKSEDFIRGQENDSNTAIMVAMPDKLKYSLIMFLAGSCYGFVVPLVRTAQNAHYNTGDIMVSQYLVAAVALSIVCLLFSRRKVGLKDALKLLGMGVVAASVSFFYYQSLLLVSPATSLTLLFQFVWMGMVFEAIRTKTLPRITAVLAVSLVVIGAVLATGMLDEGVALESLHPLGILFGLLSAVSYTAFLMLSSRVATSLPALNRTMFTAIGSFVIALAIAPTYFEHALLVIDPLLSIALGLAGICIPVYLIAVSAPKLPAGLATVMASSELPSGVICASIFLGETVSLIMGLGVVIVLVGILLSELESMRSLRKAQKKSLPSEKG